METVAPGDEVAGEFLACAAVIEADRGCLLVEIGEPRVARLEQNGSAGFDPRRDQVLQHLVLGVERDRLSASQLGQIDAMATAPEAKLDPMMHRTLALHALTYTGSPEQIDRALLEHAGAKCGLDCIATAVLEHDRLDAVDVQQVREQQTRGACADDSNLGAHRVSPER